MQISGELDFGRTADMTVGLWWRDGSSWRVELGFSGSGDSSKPSHVRPVDVHLRQCGLSSSHLIFLALQPLQSAEQLLQG
jgi:hypothetical protein